MLPTAFDNAPHSATTEQLAAAIWQVGDSFRGIISPNTYKKYLLTVLFVKYLSDQWDERQRYHQAKYAADAEGDLRVSRAMRYERFQVPEEGHYRFLYANRANDHLGELLNRALGALETANSETLAGAFWRVDFAAEGQLGGTRDLNHRLQLLVEHFWKFNFAPSHLSSQLLLGEVYETLLERFAIEAGKMPDDFYTPPSVAALLARLVEPQPGDRICDPACGSASLLLRTGRQVPGNGSFALYGQEVNEATYALARQNCVLHEQDSAMLKLGSTLTNPLLTADGRLQRFNVVVTSPPFAVAGWGQELVEKDQYQRFHRGIPPKTNSDFAFISHLVETMTESDGRGGILVPHGVLFRGGAEGRIRRQLVEEGVIEAVIGLPANLLYTTSIPLVLLLLRRRRPTTDVLFVDASRLYTDARTRPELLPAHRNQIEAVVQTFRQAGAVGKAGVLAPQLAYRATLGEVAAHEFNLSIPRYVSQSENESPRNLPDLQAELAALEEQVAEVRARMRAYVATWDRLR